MNLDYEIGLALRRVRETVALEGHPESWGFCLNDEEATKYLRRVAEAAARPEELEKREAALAAREEALDAAEEAIAGRLARERREFWKKAYLAYVGASNSKYPDYGENWADKALAAFDERLKAGKL